MTVKQLVIEEPILYGNSKPSYLQISFDYLCSLESDTLATIAISNEGSDSYLSIDVSKADVRKIIDKLKEMIDKSQ